MRQLQESSNRCPLCRSTPGEWHARIGASRYFHCPVCELVWRDPRQRLDADAERAYYGTHENDPSDPGYRRFLDRLATPLMAMLPPGAQGLDYGCGPGPALAAMLEERGFPTALFDPHFAPGTEALGRRYDFITCTETAEHFFSPADEFERLDGMLRPGGWLGVMTEFRQPARPFSSWHYLRDPTHVCFYNENTMRWLARRHGWSVEVPRANVALFRKGRTDNP